MATNRQGHLALPALSEKAATVPGNVARSARQRAVPIAAMLMITILSIVANAAGMIRDTPMLTAVASAALLLFGLPHGTFDLALIRRALAGGFSTRLFISTVVLYLACAAGMYLFWRADPLLALAAFLMMAWGHFAEDWDDLGSPLLSYGMAAAILCAPSLLHRDTLGGLFVLLTANPGAGQFADALNLLAPAALLLGIAGVFLLWRAGKRAQAISAGSALSALLLLPPVLGFALFFCLVHSPMQFKAHASALGLRSFRQWAGIVLPLSLGGLAIAAALFLMHDGPSAASSLFASSFMTLSILTVPHMLVPVLLRLLRGRQAFDGPVKTAKLMCAPD